MIDKSSHTVSCFIRSKSLRSSVGLIGPADSIKDGYIKAYEWLDKHRELSWPWNLADDDLEIEIKVGKRK